MTIRLASSLSLLVLVLLGVEGQLEFPGDCIPDVVVQKNFDVSAYTGIWHEIYRYFHKNEPSMNCVTANYTIINATAVRVNNTGVIDKKRYERYGMATPVPGITDGKLLVSFEENQEPSPYWVLETNYNSYSLVYSCRKLNLTHKAVSSWILSRKPALTAADTIAINKYMTDNANVRDVLLWDKYYHTIQWGDTCVTDAVGAIKSMGIMVILASVVVKILS